MIITIDGPAASGKSSVAKMLSCKLNYYYLNSGHLYRAVAYVLLNNPELSYQDILDNLSYKYSCDLSARVYYKSEDITQHLRGAEVTSKASVISADPELRHALLEFQRQMARDNNIVADGRDMGTVVFPDAEYKFFITASPEVRAARWRADQIKLGNNMSEAQALDWVNERDSRDINRPISPLVPAADAVVVDTSNLSLTEVLDAVLAKIK